mgnify:CR=1 FL=1
MDYDEIENMLRRLRLPRIRQVFREKLQAAAVEGLSLADLLGNLLEDELSSREESQLRSRVRRAAFPFNKTLEQFDFRRHPELRRQAFQSYLDPSFVKDGHSLVLIGPPGVGKTHLAVAIGMQQALRGADVRFSRVQKLIARVLEAPSPRERELLLKPLKKCGLLILDEFGYLLTDPETGPILYDLVAERYERGATLITSNKSLQEWGKVIGDSSLASALIDRLMHHGQVYYLKGESYRLKDKKAADGEVLAS